MTSESNLRRKAHRRGLALRKSRARQLGINNCGGWMIVDYDRNCIVAGERYDLDLEDIAEILDEIPL